MFDINNIQNYFSRDIKNPCMDILHHLLYIKFYKNNNQNFYNLLDKRTSIKLISNFFIN